MSISEKLDLAIKLKETGTTEGFYEVKYKDKTLEKQAYMSEDEWDSFFKNMKSYAREEFGNGGGGETKEKEGRPPKMASYGSSSRMIYNLSCKIDGFHFEKQLSTTVGGKANLDGFFEDDSRYVFVEAKCHEPYTAKKNVVSKSYEELYKYINEHMTGNVHVDMETSKCGKNLNVEYLVKDEKIERFDMKQMICHLLGIATGLLNGTLESKKIDFIYLLYDPTKLEIEENSKDVIVSIYERTCYESNLFNFKTLFGVILEYLRNTKFIDAMSDDDISNVVENFTFTLASQENYKALIK
jgi:hypothetical protein